MDYSIEIKVPFSCYFVEFYHIYFYSINNCPVKGKIIKIYLNIYFIGFLFFSEGKLYSSTSLIFKYCISFRNHPASRRNIRAHPGARRGLFWSSGKCGRFNWSPELWFGRARIYGPYRHLCRQVPVHNLIILCNFLYLIFLCI